MLSFRLLLSLLSVGAFTTFWLLVGTQQPAQKRQSVRPAGGLSATEVVSLRDQILQNGARDKPWDHIYVVNLASRSDRRTHMTKLADALDLNLTFVDAVTTQDAVVPWVLERLMDDQIAADAFEGFGGDYRDPPRWGPRKSLTWRQHALTYFSSPSPSSHFALKSSSTPPASAGPLSWPPVWLRTNPDETHDPHGPTACTLSHLKVLEMAIAAEDQTILVLEDDVDAEFGLVERWDEMLRGLEEREEGWDMVYLGHIQSNEKDHKPTFNPHLRPANVPLGTHAYSLSHRGARRLHRYLTTSPALFSRPIDHELAWGAVHESRYGSDVVEDWEFEAWSAVPPVIAPGDGRLGTDVGGGGGTGWGALLSDSTLARIAAYEGHPFRPLTDEEVSQMGAVNVGM